MLTYSLWHWAKNRWRHKHGRVKIGLLLWFISVTGVVFAGCVAPNSSYFETSIPNSLLPTAEYAETPDGDISASDSVPKASKNFLTETI